MSDPTRTLTLRPDDEDAIRGLVEKASRAQSDPDLLVPMHTPQAVIVNFFGRRILGRDTFEEAMRAALSSPLSDVTTDVEIIDLRPVTDAVALVSCVKTVHDHRESAEGSDLPAAAGALTYVVTRTGDAWQIALAQTTPMLT